MKMHKRLAAVGVAAAATVGLAFTGTAGAAFPNFSDCPRAQGALFCVNIQNTGGFLDIKGFSVPLRDSLEIRGGLGIDATGTRTVFLAPSGTNGFFARPVAVPGGILGIDFPIPGNSITATATLAGPPASIRIDPQTFALAFPLKLVLDNPILGPFCRIGTDANPAQLNLIQGTTNPPAPNTPISGRRGTPAHTPTYLQFNGNHNVDNSFSVPGASNCGIGLGLVNSLVNLKLRIPSAGGNNTIISENNFALQF